MFPHYGVGDHSTKAIFFFSNLRCSLFGFTPTKFCQILTNLMKWNKIAEVWNRAIGLFRVPKNLTFKAKLSAKPLIWKWFLIMMQIKLIFTTKVSHLASFWKWDFMELRNGVFKFTFQVALSVCCHPGNLPPWQHDVTNSLFAECTVYFCVLFICVSN